MLRYRYNIYRPNTGVCYRLVREDGREGEGEEKTHDVDPYAQTVLSEEHYVGEFDDIPLEWPTVPYSHKICRCCYNAGIFETIYNREEPVPGLCPCIHVKSLSPINREKDDSYTLGRMGWRVCLIMAFFPLALPFRACAQHKKIKDVYPVETEGYKVRNLRYTVFLKVVRLSSQ